MRVWFGRPILTGVRGVQFLVNRPPITLFAQLFKGVGQLDCEFLQGVLLRPAGRNGQPCSSILAQAWDQAGAHQRRLPTARCAQAQDERWPTLAPQTVQHFKTFLDVSVAAEEDRRILLLKCQEAGIGRTGRIPFKGFARFDPDFFEASGQPPITLIWIHCQIHVLDVREKSVGVAGRDFGEKYWFTCCPGLGDLGETPPRLQPVR